MKKTIAIAIAALSLASFAKTEKLGSVTVADIESLTKQAAKLGEQCGMPMIGMMAAQGLQSNPVTEQFGQMRPGDPVTVSFYGDPEKFSMEDDGDAFMKTFGVSLLYPSAKTKAQFLADNPGSVETNGVVVVSGLFPMYVTFSADGKWLVAANDLGRAKSALAGLDKHKNKVAFGAAFDARVSEAGMGLLNKVISGLLPMAKSEMSAAEAAQLDRAASVLSQMKKCIVAMRVTDRGVDVLGSLAPVDGTELAKCGEKPFKANPLAFAGKDAFFASAVAPDCGCADRADSIDKVLAYLKSKGMNTDFVTVARKGAECKIALDFKKAVAYAMSEEAGRFKSSVSDPVDFVKGLQAAVAGKTDGTFKAASPECLMSLSLADATLQSTPAERYAKEFPGYIKNKKPFYVFTGSFYAFFKNAVTAGLAAAPQSDETKRIASMFAALPPEGNGSFFSTSWKEKGEFRGICRVTPDELKGIVTLGTMAFTMASSSRMTLPAGGDGEWDGDDDDASTAK